jgi:hypothetical protein
MACEGNNPKEPTSFNSQGEVSISSNEALYSFAQNTVQNYSSEDNFKSSIAMFSSSSYKPQNLKVLLNQFPKGILSPDSIALLRWTLLGDNVKEYQARIHFKYMSDTTLYPLDSVSNHDSAYISYNSFNNGDRIQLILSVKVADQVLTDKSQYFDIHTGTTVFRYSSNPIQSFFQNYCTNCHGTEGGLSLESYKDITKGNTPLYIMNRVNFIGDMPPPEEENQPSIELRLKIRDWILGGVPL